MLGGVCVATLAVFVIDIGNDDSWGGRAVVYISICNITFVAAVVYLAAGLATRRPGSGALMPPS